MTPEERIEIEIAEGRLHELVETYARGSEQLSAYGLPEPLIRKIIEAYPGKYQLEPRGVPMLKEFAVSLAPISLDQPKLIPVTEPQPEPPQTLEQIFSAEDLAIMRRKPASRFMSTRPGMNPKNMQNRVRNPMVRI